MIMSNLLLVSSTGHEISQGTALHAQTGPAAGSVWRFEHISERPDGAHRVHVTRFGGHRRVHREFHPSVFGCEIKALITWVRHVRNVVHKIRTKVDDYLIAGTFALIPLALYEHFHWSETIVAALTAH